MAESIAIWLFTTYATATGTTVVVSAATLAFVTGVITFVAVTAASMAVSKLLAPKPPSYSDASLSQRSQMVRSPISARNMVYGRCRVSGTVVYMSTTGTKNEYIHIVVTLAGHEIEEIQEVYFNDEIVPLVSNTPTGFYNGVARVNKKLGVPGDTADADLIADTASLTDGKWTSDHKLSGIAYLYVRLTWDAEKFPSGIPNISAVVKGKKVYDPRTTTTVYSANPALCFRDYLTDTMGMGMTSAEVDDTAITAAANICEEQVQILPLSPTTYENRYECNGVIATSAAPDENIGKLLSAMGGLVAYSGGKIVPYAGGYRIPTVTLSEKHFVGPLNVQTRTSARDRVNSVKGVYVSEGNGWQVSDFPSISSSTYVTADNGVRYWRDVVLPFTTSASCAQRLAVIELRRAREEITFSARFRLEAMQVRAGDTVMITNAKLGWSAKVFEVMEWHFASDGNPPQIYIDMTLRETASSVYSWTVSDEIAVDDAPNTTLPDPFTLGAPSSLALTADGTTQFIQADGTAVPRIKLTWTPPPENFIQSGGAVVIEYKPSTSTTYLTWARVEGAQTEDYISSDVRIGVNYDVRIFGESYFKISTSYVSAAITVAPDTTPPAVPTGLTAIAGTGQIISLDWDDNVEPDFGEYGIWRNTVNDSATSTKISEARASRFVDVNLTLGVTYYYWITAYDRSENQSAKSTGANATAVAVTAGEVDNTAPSNPSAPTLSSSTTYLAGDGTVFSQLTINVPVLPTGAYILNLLYRKNGASGWLIADQRSSGGGTTAIDDLTPGVSYEVAAQAFSAFGVGSGIVAATGSPFTAPNKTAAPSDPTSLTHTSGSDSSYSRGPVYQSSVLVPTCWHQWAIPSDKDLAGWEWSIQGSNVAPSTAPGTGFFTSIPEAISVNPVFNPRYFFVRSFDTTGNYSNWVSSGINLSPTYYGYAAGNISNQNSDDVEVSSIQTGDAGAVSVRAVVARYPINHVETLVGGAPTETFAIDISNRGFLTKPEVGQGNCSSDPNLSVAYDWGAAGNSSTSAAVVIATLDGANIPAGAARFNLEFIGYT